MVISCNMYRNGYYNDMDGNHEDHNGIGMCITSRRTITNDRYNYNESYFDSLVEAVV